MAALECDMANQSAVGSVVFYYYGGRGPPLQVNEMRNTHFGQNTNSFK